MHEFDRSHDRVRIEQMKAIVDVCLPLIEVAIDASVAYRPLHEVHKQMIKEVSETETNYDIVIGSTPEQVEKEKYDTQLEKLRLSIEIFQQKINELIKSAIETPVATIESALQIRFQAMTVQNLALQLGRWLTDWNVTISPRTKEPLVLAMEKLLRLAENVHLKPGETAITSQELEQKKTEISEMLGHVRLQTRYKTVDAKVMGYESVYPENQGKLKSLLQTLESLKSESLESSANDPYAGYSHFDMDEGMRSAARDYYRSHGTKPRGEKTEIEILQLVDQELQTILASFELK